MTPSASLSSPAFETRDRSTARGALAFGRFAWFLIAYNLLVVLGGTYVRASKSGDGCGAHWPLCNGEIVPNGVPVKTWIEFAHRQSSALLLLVIIGFLVWSFRLFPKGHLVRRGATFVLLFTLVEAWIGAVLVKKKLVADNASASRALYLSIHLVNTFVLLGWLTFTAWASRAQADGNFPRLKLRGQGGVLVLIAAGLFLTVWVSVSGAVAALGDTLYPASSLSHALAQDFSPTSNLLIRLRLLHPTLAISTAIFLAVMVALVPRLRPSPQVQFWAKTSLAIFCFQVGFGLLNVINLAPIWMQIGHLLIADTIWISLTMMSYSALSAAAPRAVLEESTPTERATIKDYVMLTKPRVISLLIFTTWAAMIMAARGWPGFTLFALTGLGFYMAAGGAHVINMVIDRDIDKRTERTASRAVASGKISVRNALLFAGVLSIGSFLILWLGANLLSALMAFSGLAFYVIVYTLLLKRRTWSNIVIGGAAGAFPPLVGWAAVTNHLAPLAWLLFGIIFLWTPVHFWALAILIKDDYATNGIPMLPVVKGNRATASQIFWYAISTVLISLVPFALQENGARMASWIYLIAAIVLNGVLLWRCVLLQREPAKPRARWLFHYSMLYLFLLFLALAVDRAVI